MNKPLAFLLIGSLVLNALLGVAYLSQKTDLEKATTTADSNVKTDATERSATTPTDQLPVIAFEDLPPVELTKALRAIGLPEEVVRAAVGIRVRKKYSDRIREIAEAEKRTANRYWLPHNTPEIRQENAEGRAELQKLSDEARLTMTEIFGPEENRNSTSRSLRQTHGDHRRPTTRNVEQRQRRENRRRLS